MKQFYAADLHTQTEITDFFMVKSAGIKVGSNKKQYFAEKWMLEPFHT